MKICRRFSVVTLPLLLLIESAAAADSSPIRLPNSLPIHSGSGLGSPKDAWLDDNSPWNFELTAHLQSHANEAGSISETLILDGEVQSFSSLIRWNFRSRWQANLEIGVAKNTAGNLDSVIDSWHDTFGLDNGDRDLFAQDQFRFEYSDAAGRTQLAPSASGLTDIEAGLAYQAVSNKAINLSLHLGAALPTGNAQNWLGSDKVDFKLSAALASANRGRVGWHANGGVIFIGDQTLFGATTQSTVGFSSLGLHWQPSQHWRWSAQIDAHQAAFKSAIPELSKTAAQFALGLEYRRWQVYFAEDLSVNRAADFSFGLRWRYAK